METRAITSFGDVDWGVEVVVLVVGYLDLNLSIVVMVVLVEVGKFYVDVGFFVGSTRS